MRSKNEVEDGETLITFIQTDLPKTGLIVASPNILADTVRILRQTISLLDKALQLKAVFNWVQRSQRVQYLSQALMAIRIQKAPMGSDERMMNERAKAIAIELSQHLALYLESPDRGMQIDPALNVFVSPEEFQLLEQQATQFLTTEDIFVAACMFLQVQISKDRSMLFVSGESPDFKDSKRERQPVNLDEAAKSVSHSLSRPDNNRGSVEQNCIASAFNHLVKLNKFYAQIKAVAAYLNEDADRTKKDAMQFFKLSSTSFENIMVLARREGIVEWRIRRRPATRLPINASNQDFIAAWADARKITEAKALNQIVALYARAWRLQEKQRIRNGLPHLVLDIFNQEGLDDGAIEQETDCAQLCALD